MNVVLVMVSQSDRRESSLCYGSARKDGERPSSPEETIGMETSLF